jgi:hypothetical protein
MMMRKIFILLLLVLFAGCSKIEITNFDECVAAGYPVMESYPRQCSDGENTFTEKLDMQALCVKENGRWINDYNECEGISKDSCESLGGSFNECGSACRHNPEDSFCTMQCVAYCSFE